MSELIDREALAKVFADDFSKTLVDMTYSEYISAVRNAPTIDAVQVVRCGECEHGNVSAFMGDGWVHCKHSNLHNRDDQYCSFGKRRESEGV